MSDTLALILARAGSRGLPGKNARPIAGRPMLAWTIDHALSARSVDHIALTTDGPGLAAIARDHGIDVVDRPAELANDTATVDSAARHAVDVLETRRDTRFAHVVLLYANIPIRPDDLTDRALAKLRQTGCDSVQSLSPVGKTHPYWMKRLGEDDALLPYEPNTVYRRQDLPPVYMLDGGIIAVARESLFTVEPGQPHAFLGRDRRAIVNPPESVVDVDSELDFHVAEAILRGADQPNLHADAG